MKCPQVGKDSVERKLFRGTCRPGLPSMKRFTGMWNFGAKTDQVPGKPGVGHPTK